MIKAENRFNAAATLVFTLPLIGIWLDLYGAPTRSLDCLSAFMIGEVLLFILLIVTVSVPSMRRGLNEGIFVAISSTLAVICLTGIFGSIAVYLWDIHFPSAVASTILAIIFGIFSVGAIGSSSGDFGPRGVPILGIFFR